MHPTKRRRCTRLVLVGAFAHRDRVGANHFRFSGRVNGRALEPGRYVFEVTAELAGQTSRQLSARFQILSPPRTCSDPDHDGNCDAPGAF